MVTPVEARVRQKDVINNAEKYFHNSPSIILHGPSSAFGIVSGCLTAYPGVASSIPAQPRTFVEIDHEIISTAILFPSVDAFKKGCCQLQAKVCARITG